jgi:hypothetical protein
MWKTEFALSDRIFSILHNTKFCWKASEIRWEIVGKPINADIFIQKKRIIGATKREKSVAVDFLTVEKSMI